MNSTFKDKVILITGGVGSLGQHLVKKLLEYQPKAIRILDNRESELFYMEESFKDYPNLRFLVGDIRDKERLILACEDVDIIFHLAALKHVRSSEFNPFEAIKTNITGTQNIVEAALKNDVEKVIYTSSDKAVNPHNLMGATKLIGERIITAANYYRGKKRTIFSSVRFGNVMETNGSVIPLWKKQIETNQEITITDPEMTRFMMSKDQAINLVLKCAELSQGGETFILKMPVVKLGDLVEVVTEGKQTNQKIIGKKEGETLFEELMTEHEVSKAIETKEMYIFPSLFEQYFKAKQFTYPDTMGIKTEVYDSRNQSPISKEEVRKMLTGTEQKEKVIAIIQARMGADRLPNKTLELIEYKPLLHHIIDRIKACKKVDEIVIATTTNPYDDQIEEFAKRYNIKVFRGSESDVLDRYYKSAKLFNAPIIVRVTADDPFKDPIIIDEIISNLLESPELDYASNTIEPTYPEGIDIEVFRFKALEKSWKEATNQPEREHVTQYIMKNPDKFKTKNIKNNEDLSKLRWTIDYKEDLDFAREIYKRLYKPGQIFLMNDILNLLKENPELMEINNKIEQRSWENE